MATPPMETLKDLAAIFTTESVDPNLVRVRLEPDAYNCLRQALSMDVPGPPEGWFQIDGIVYERS